MDNKIHIMVDDMSESLYDLQRKHGIHYNPSENEIITNALKTKQDGEEQVIYV